MMLEDRPRPARADHDMETLQTPQIARFRLITMKDLCSRLQISRSSVERAVRADPSFPQPRTLPGGRLVRFVETEVDAYIERLPKAKYDDHAFDPDDTRESS